jgi:DNA-binding GntR family transcriptional regulator
VSRRSDALDLEPGVFTWDDPVRIARSLQRSAEASRRRKREAYASAMAMLCFYINRAGRNLSEERRAVLERSKEELRRLYGRTDTPGYRAQAPP